MMSKFLPLFSTSLLYILYYLISWLKFDVRLWHSAIIYDFVLQLFVSYILYALSKRTWIFLIIQSLVMGILYVGNAIKISFFGGPIVPDDAFALRSLLLILEGWQFFAAAIPLAAIASLLFFNFSMRHWSAYLASVVAVVLILTVAYQPNTILEPIDKYTGTSVWDQRSNYLSHGATLYSLQETTRFFATADVPPDNDATRAAAESLLSAAVKQPATDKPFTPRNVHMVLLESFWDAGTLKKAGYNQNPLSSQFRKLWKSAGNSHALSPVFGGYTANAEFEVLCGFPVTKNSVKFERQLINEVPCLPHILADKGYRTVVSHPNVPVFWNRVNAYRNIGFQSYWSKDDFQLDDMNGTFLADSSLYRQVLEKLAGTMNKKEPVLDYIVTYFGHWNYALSESRTPKVTSKSKVEEVTSYANMVYYKSSELVEFIEQLTQRDPDSVIVVFGDHLPFLGKNYAGYDESGVLTASPDYVDTGILTGNRSDFSPEMFKFYVSTPLIVIDGQKGAVKVGSLPLYQIPKLVLGLLNFNEPSIMDYTDPSPDSRIRPLPGLHLTLPHNGGVELCKEPPFSKNCQDSSRWLENVLVVSNDLFIGRQYSRPAHSVAAPVAPDRAELEGTPVSHGPTKTERNSL